MHSPVPAGVSCTRGRGERSADHHVPFQLPVPTLVGSAEKTQTPTASFPSQIPAAPAPVDRVRGRPPSGNKRACAECPGNGPTK